MDRTQDEVLRVELRNAVAGIDVQCSRQSRPDLAQLRRTTTNLMRRALAEQERPVRS
jgi:hypothetical protein